MELKITCAQCQKPVEKCLSYYDSFHMRTVISVYCHGDTDTAYIDDIITFQLSKEKLLEGLKTAFTIKRLSPVVLQITTHNNHPE